MPKRRKRTNKNIPAKGRLRDIADKLWSLAVRDDWAGRCAVCGGEPVEAHHLIPRQYEKTRYDLDNGVALCARHHKLDKDSPHQNAAAWLDWLRVNLPTQYATTTANPRPTFSGIVNWVYLADIIQSLKEYVDEDEFIRVVGVRFSKWLEEQS